VVSDLGDMEGGCPPWKKVGLLINQDGAIFLLALRFAVRDLQMSNQNS
jgi:hypothetical protein